MLQISQTEKPICSATIDQIRLRRATVLPVVFQNASSSGRQSEIQVGFPFGFFVIDNPFWSHRCFVAVSASRHGGALRGSIPGGEFTMLIDDVWGRRRWRRK